MSDGSADDRLREALSGALTGILYFLLFIYVIPLILSYLLAGYLDVGGSWVDPLSYLPYLIIFLLLSAASTLLRGSVLSPLLDSLSIIIGFSIIASLMGVASEVTISLPQGGTMEISLDLEFLLAVLMLALPVSMISPFIRHLLG